MNSKRLIKSSILAGLLGLSLVARAENGVTDTEILVGMVNNTSGPTATSGINFNAGPRVFFEKLNKQGGINGRKVTVNYYDDAYEPEKAVSETRKAIESDKVFVVMNNNGTPTAKAVLPIIVKSQVPFLFPRTGDASVRDPFEKNIFNLRASFANEVNALVKELVVKKGMKKVAVLSQQDAFGASIRSPALKALHENGVKGFVAEGPVERNSTDITKAFETIEKAEPEVVLLAVTQAAAVPFIKKAHASGKKWTFTSANNNNPVAEKLAPGEGDNVVLSQVTPNPESSNLPIAKQFREDMKAAKQEKFINYIAFEGYINAVLFAEAAKRAGKSLTRQSLIQALEAEPFDLGGVKVKFSSTDHSGDLPVFLSRIKGTSIVDY